MKNTSVSVAQPVLPAQHSDATADLVGALQYLRDQCQQSRKFIVLSDDEGYALYQSTAEAIQRADVALAKAACASRL